MEKEFNKTNIPEDYSKILTQYGLLACPSNAYRIATSLLHGTFCYLDKIKSITIPKAVVFRSMDHSFLAGAKMEFIPDSDDPSNPETGHWDYIWTFYEDDLKGAYCIDVSANNSTVATYVRSSCFTLYHAKFAVNVFHVITIMTVMVEMIINWLKENATEADPAALVLDGAFRAECCVTDGRFDLGLVLDDDMKALIKDGVVIQEAS